MLNTERLCVGCMNDNGGEKVCSICGYDSKIQNGENYLPTRYWLKDRYLIGRVLDFNGEGVTYIGWDNKEDRIVNIREYYPPDASKRNADKTVSISAGNEFVFNEGIMNFLDLHKKLLTLSDLPALLPTVEVFEENGTAYSVIKSVSGITLREFLIRNGGSLNWEQARPLFLPLITTLQGLHEANIIHRGISPETVIVGRDGKLRLSGICVRDVRMSKSSLPVQLFPGFSATEQYGFDLELKDGKYTDVYGIAATLFRTLVGAAPTDASERISNDNMQIPARLAGELPKYVLTALANGLQIMPQNRIKDMEAFRLALTPVSSEATIAFSAQQVKSEPKPSEHTQVQKSQAPAKKEQNNSGKKYAIISSAVTAAVFIILAAVFFILTKEPAEVPNKSNGGDTQTPTVSQGENNTEPDTDSESTIGEKLYQVPDLVGRSYAEIIKNIDYKVLFEFEVTDKQFSDKYPKGYVIAQTPNSEQTAKKGTKISVTLSLGPRVVSIADLSGKTKEQAILELMKQGFLYENIIFEDVYDISKTPNAVISTEPSAGTKVDTDTAVTVTWNSYTGQSGTGESDGSSSENKNNTSGTSGTN